MDRSHAQDGGDLFKERFGAHDRDPHPQHVAACLQPDGRAGVDRPDAGYQGCEILGLPEVGKLEGGRRWRNGHESTIDRGRLFHYVLVPCPRRIPRRRFAPCDTSLIEL